MDKSVSRARNNGRTPEFPTQALKAEYLSLIDIFRELPSEEITRLAAELPMRTYSPGGVIYAPGEPSDVLFLLKRGTVNIVQQVPGGKRLVTEVLHAYTFFGEMALVGERFPDWASAQAVDDVLVCLINQAVIEQLVLTYPRLGLRLLERVTMRLGDVEAALAAFAYAPISARLARVVLRLAEQDPARVVHASHDQLAALVGTYRETITTALRQLRRLGLVELGRRSIQVLDMRGLKQLGATWLQLESGGGARGSPEAGRCHPGPLGPLE
jgi:CRP-like cAMP-binding protein